MNSDDLRHFGAAQEHVYDTALAELRDGHKTTHWMWFVFPQIAGLGTSAMAQRYAIADLDHARRFLAHPVLGPRLRQCTEAILAADAGLTIRDILGSPDDMKFRSCMTLFVEAADTGEDRHLFQNALDRFCGGDPDPATLDILARR